MKIAYIALALSTLFLLGCRVESTTTTTLSDGASPEAASDAASPASETAAPSETAPTDAAPAAAAPAGDKASEVTVKILSYDEVQKLLASHKGKVVVMDAWSTSCEPCVKEFPKLVALHRKYGPAKLACVSLSFDYEGLGKPEEVVPDVKKFLEQQGATFDNVVCSDDSDALYKKMELASIPAVYVYRADGTLAKRFDNENAQKPEDAFNYEHVARLVAELIEGKSE